MKKRINFYIILVTIVVAWMSLSSFTDKPKCQGKTLSGEACSRNAAEGTNYCWQHNPLSIHCSGKTKKNENCKRVVKKQGEYCFQHKK